jgi:hypothetical protein
LTSIEALFCLGDREELGKPAAVPWLRERCARLPGLDGANGDAEGVGELLLREIRRLSKCSEPRSGKRGR